jgi:hypothetical protein
MSAFDPKRTWNERERVSPFDPRASAARDRGNVFAAKSWRLPRDLLPSLRRRNVGDQHAEAAEQ